MSDLDARCDFHSWGSNNPNKVCPYCEKISTNIQKLQSRIEALEKEAARLVRALKHQEGLGACVCAKGQSTVGANKLCNLCKALSDCPLAMKLIENKNG